MHTYIDSFYLIPLDKIYTLSLNGIINIYKMVNTNNKLDFLDQ